MLMGSPPRYSRVMRTPTPTHVDPAPCDGQSLECLLCGLGLVALFPLALWIVAEPLLASLVLASVVLVTVTLVGLLRGDAPLFDQER